MPRTVPRAQAVPSTNYPAYMRTQFVSLMQERRWIGGFALLQCMKIHGSQGLEEALLRLFISRAPVKYRALYIIDRKDPDYPSIHEMFKAGLEKVYRTNYKFQRLYTKLIYEIVMTRRKEQMKEVEDTGDFTDPDNEILLSIQHSVCHFLHGECDHPECDRGVDEEWRKMIVDVDTCLRDEPHRRTLA